MEKNISISEPVIGKTDSFFGNRSVVLSKKQVKSVKENPLAGELYITDIGFYPNAKNHFRKRKKGINEHILIYCIDGTGFIHIDDTIFEMMPNSFFIIPAHKAHTYWASESLPWSIYWLHFGGKRSCCFEELFCRPIPIEPSMNSRIDERIKLFNELLIALELGFSTENINYANLCLNSLLASFFYVESFRAVKGFQSSNPVDQSIFFMQKNINKPIKLGDISNFVKLSESHYTKIFRNRTGSSPFDYFINLKMQEAIRLLTNQSLKIKEVAFKLGYNDPYYFTRLFTKHIGSSPASFVKMSSR
jgi:AraC-like DNA-binding protein